MTEKSYANQDLTGQSFAGKDLTGVDFSGANLTDVNFAGAIIKNTDFRDAIFSRTLMVGTQLQEANNLPEDRTGIIHNISRLGYLCGKLNGIMPSIQQKLSDAHITLEAQREVERAENGGSTPSAGWRKARIEEAQNALAEILSPPLRSGVSK
jgi:hypothetical protein